tara:strand:- start:5599 stop:5907 length:309 start_codon:yes stop_codon:yes gene_type:complete
MKWLVPVLIILLAFLQYQLWFSNGSYFHAWTLKHDLSKQQAKTQQLTERNKALEAEVKDLKQGHQAVEELARNELGMVKQGETFYQIVGGKLIKATPPPAES